MAIVRHIKTNEVYEYLGENVFVNLRTNVSGIVPTDIAQKIFKINIELTELIAGNPNIKTLINSLKLSLAK